MALFLTVGAGALVGRLRFRSVVLGAVTGTLLVGVLVGQAGVTLDPIIKTAAFAASLFALGYNVGPQFFAGLRSDGLRQLSLATISCLLALLGAIIVAKAFGYGMGWGAGLLAGGLTQSSVIGVSSAAIEELPGISPEQAMLLESQIAVGFSVCYLVSTAAGAYFLSGVAPRLVGVRDLPAAARQVERRLGVNSNPDVASGYYSIVRRAYRLEPSHLVGRTVQEAELDARARGHTLVLHRMRRDDVISVLTPATVLHVGDTVTVSTRRRHLTAEDPTTFGVEIDDPELLGYDVQELPIIVTNKRFAGKTLSDVMTEVAPRIFVNTVLRAGVKVPWSASTLVQLGDEICVQGIADEVESAAARLGYPLRTTPATDPFVCRPWHRPRLPYRCSDDRSPDRKVRSDHVRRCTARWSLPGVPAVPPPRLRAVPRRRQLAGQHRRTVRVRRGSRHYRRSALYRRPSAGGPGSRSGRIHRGAVSYGGLPVPR
jgi:putative transport protein